MKAYISTADGDINVMIDRTVEYYWDRDEYKFHMWVDSEGEYRSLGSLNVSYDVGMDYIKKAFCIEED